MVHSRQITISFDECDPAGLLFFGRYFALAHRGIEDFVRQSEIGWDIWFSGQPFLVPIRHAEGEYLRPLWAGHSYQLDLIVLSVGESSVRFQTKFSENNLACAILTTTHVFVDAKTKKKVPIPEKIAKNLKQYLD